VRLQAWRAGLGPHVAGWALDDQSAGHHVVQCLLPCGKRRHEKTDQQDQGGDNLAEVPPGGAAKRDRVPSVVDNLAIDALPRIEFEAETVARASRVLVVKCTDLTSLLRMVGVRSRQ